MWSESGSKVRCLFLTCGYRGSHWLQMWTQNSTEAPAGGGPSHIPGRRGGGHMAAVFPPVLVGRLGLSLVWLGNQDHASVAAPPLQARCDCISSSHVSVELTVKPQARVSLWKYRKLRGNPAHAEAPAGRQVHLFCEICGSDAPRKENTPHLDLGESAEGSRAACRVVHCPPTRGWTVLETSTRHRPLASRLSLLLYYFHANFVISILLTSQFMHSALPSSDNG